MRARSTRRPARQTAGAAESAGALVESTRTMMSTTAAAVGETIRRLRLERDLSLADVAGKAGISVASLSRVETNKQSVDVELLLKLAQVLSVAPAELMGGAQEVRSSDTLARELARLAPAERARIFLQSRRHDAKQLPAAVDDLLSTIDVLREDLVELQRTVARRRR